MLRTANNQIKYALEVRALAGTADQRDQFRLELLEVRLRQAHVDAVVVFGDDLRAELLVKGDDFGVALAYLEVACREAQPLKDLSRIQLPQEKESGCAAGLKSYRRTVPQGVPSRRSTRN